MQGQLQQLQQQLSRAPAPAAAPQPRGAPQRRALLQQQQHYTRAHDVQFGLCSSRGSSESSSISISSRQRHVLGSLRCLATLQEAAGSTGTGAAPSAAPPAPAFDPPPPAAAAVSVGSDAAGGTSDDPGSSSSGEQQHTLHLDQQTKAASSGDLQQQQQQPELAAALLSSLENEQQQRQQRQFTPQAQQQQLQQQHQRVPGLGDAGAPPDMLWHVRRTQHQRTRTRVPGRSLNLVSHAAMRQQRQQQGLTLAAGPMSEVQGLPDVGFTLLEDRLHSHAAASSSGRSHTNSGSSSSNSSNGTGADAAAVAASSSSQDGGAALPLQQLLALRRSPAANFRDPAFEAALSRWMKQAPDWFKVRQVYEEYAPRFNIVHVACALSCIADLTAARLAAKPVLRVERAALDRFVGQLLTTCAQLAPSADAATTAVLLHALARLSVTRKLRSARTARPLVAALLAHAQPVLGGLAPAELGALVWALKRLRHAPSPSWWAALYADSLPLLPQLSGLEAGLLLRSMAVLRAPAPPAAWMSALLGHVEELLPELDPRHLSTALMGVAGLQVQPPRAWTAAVLDALRARFDELGPQTLSNVLWSLARLRLVPDRAWLRGYFAASAQLLASASFNRQELSLDLWSMSRLRLEPSDQWLDEFFDATEAQLLRFTMQDLALLGYSLAKLGLRPPQTWLRRYCTLLLRLKGQLWRNKAQLSQVLVALAAFHVPRMDVWRRELYAAAGYRLYRFPNWRQRARAQQPVPQGPYSVWPGGARRRLRRFGGSAAAAVFGQAAAAAARPPPVVLRSTEWMDGMPGGGGLGGGSMSSYDELPAAAASVGAWASPAQPGASSAGTRSRSRMPGLVRPRPPRAAGAAAAAAAGAPRAAASPSSSSSSSSSSSIDGGSPPPASGGISSSSSSMEESSSEASSSRPASAQGPGGAADTASSDGAAWARPAE